MKRLLLLPVFALFALAACETEGAKEYSVDVINSSSKTVRYTYKGSTDTLPSSGFRNYHVEANTAPPKGVIADNNVISVKLLTHSPGGKYEFVDIKPIPLYIINNLPVPVRVTVAGYLEDNNGNPFVECQKQTPDGTPPEPIAKIYTDKPVFISSPQYTGRQDYSYYPVTFEWELRDIPKGDGTTERHMYLVLQ
jgi:hypothetical protein